MNKLERWKAMYERRQMESKEIGSPAFPGCGYLCMNEVGKLHIYTPGSVEIDPVALLAWLKEWLEEPVGPTNSQWWSSYGRGIADERMRIANEVKRNIAGNEQAGKISTCTVVLGVFLGQLLRFIEEPKP